MLDEMEHQASEVEWLQRLKDGDTQALAFLFKEYSEMLFSVINRIVQNADQARDLVQEVFCKIWIGRGQLNILSIKPYLVRAAVNEALMYLRSQHARFVHLDTQEIAGREEADQDAKSEELQGAINQAIAQMPPQRRAAFTLSRFEQMSYTEIARHLNISKKTVEKHISKALETLRISLKPYFHLLLVFLRF